MNPLTANKAGNFRYSATYTSLCIASQSNVCKHSTNVIGYVLCWPFGQRRCYGCWSSLVWTAAAVVCSPVSTVHRWIPRQTAIRWQRCHYIRPIWSRRQVAPLADSSDRSCIRSRHRNCKLGRSTEQEPPMIEHKRTLALDFLQFITTLSEYNSHIYFWTQRSYPFVKIITLSESLISFFKTSIQKGVV